MENNFKAPQTPEVKLHFLDYWRIIRIRKTVILAVFLLVVLTTTAVTYILPKSYMSSVRIKLEKNSSDVDPMGGVKNPNVFDPYFIQTEFEVIQSKTVHHKVIEKMELNKKWAARYGTEGVELKTPQAFLLLKRNVEIRQFRFGEGPKPHEGQLLPALAISLRDKGGIGREPEFILIFRRRHLVNIENMRRQTLSERTAEVALNLAPVSGDLNRSVIALTDALRHLQKRFFIVT